MTLEHIKTALLFLALLLFAAGLWLALIGSPPDARQGDAVRIMYVHVPAAWLSIIAYLLMGLAAALGLIRRRWSVPFDWMDALAPIGMVFTVLCLVTGMIWGKPMWGTFWVWDPRLTSMLVLLFLYMGYLALSRAFDNPERGLRMGAVLVLIGALDLPVIWYSVQWWSTLHQPFSFKGLGKPAISQEMLAPLWVMLAAYSTFFAHLVLRLVHIKRRKRK
ncbi:MAG: heme ABC transporter permease CcmC [Pseudomonadota bacterium]|nr:heme ABC transporter permease CcmC [Pseudomonadota bacterium]